MSYSSKHDAKEVKSFIANTLTSNINLAASYIACRAIGKDPILAKKVETLKTAAKDVVDYIDSRLG